jgi:3-hydroxyacyl-[acyl-carrier-protein] dehydratase
MAQAAGLLIIKSIGERKKNEVYFFAAIDKARFKRQVIPGDQLVFDIKLLRMARGVSKFTAIASVDGQVAAEAEIMIAKKEVY